MTQNRKVAVVTGAGSGIGRACALSLHEDGYVIAMLGRSKDKLALLQQDGLHAYHCDVADRQQVDKAIAAIKHQHGRIDVLVNSAGIFSKLKAEEITDDAVAQMLGINLLGTINCCLASLPLLKESHGSIINISSALAHRPRIGNALYAASKAGVEGFSKGLAVDLGVSAGVRVNVLSLGLVDTGIFDQLSAGQRSQFIAERAKLYPLGRIGNPDDIAGMVSFLVSERASWLTGAVIPVDGGASAYGGP